MRPEFEDELRAALQPPEPPPDLVDRVLARVQAPVAAPPAAPTLWWAWLRPWPAVALALCLIVAVVLVEWRSYRVRQEQVRGELAKEQILQALRLAGGKLHEAREKVQEIQ